MKVVYAIIGTRPQLIKHAALVSEHANQFKLITIHTGQHYDWNMDQLFFGEFSLREPDYHLQVGSASPVSQIAKMVLGIEKICLENPPNLILVYGDTNSALEGALVAKKVDIPLAHIEAGMRSGNPEMPEEINRLLTDQMANILFTSCTSATDNLIRENIVGVVFETGDLMKDLTLKYLNQKKLQKIIIDEPFYYATIHRPYNTDDKYRLIQIFAAMQNLDAMVIFSCHPRTLNRIKQFNIDHTSFSNIQFIEPQDYHMNLSYMHAAKAVITDSGGMQKEAYWLKKKCITLRKETEWTETLRDGANTIIFDELYRLTSFARKPAAWNSDLYGDGKAAKNIIEYITHYLQEYSQIFPSKSKINS